MNTTSDDVKGRSKKLAEERMYHIVEEIEQALKLAKSDRSVAVRERYWVGVRAEQFCQLGREAFGWNRSTAIYELRMFTTLSESTIRRHMAFARIVGQRVYIPLLMKGMTWTEAQERVDEFVNEAIRREEYEEVQEIKKRYASLGIKLGDGSTANGGPVA